MRDDAGLETFESLEELVAVTDMLDQIAAELEFTLASGATDLAVAPLLEVRAGYKSAPVIDRASTLPRFPARRNSCVGNQGTGALVALPCLGLAAYQTLTRLRPCQRRPACSPGPRRSASTWRAKLLGKGDHAAVTHSFRTRARLQSCGRCADRRSASTLLTPAAVPPAAAPGCARPPP